MIEDTFPTVRTSGYAVASLACGLLWMVWVGSVLALVFGYVARRDILASQGALVGDGMANVGIALGWLAFLGPPAVLIGMSLG